MIQPHFSATSTLASVLGVFGGLIGMEHGYLETLQGKVPLRSMIIDAIGRQPSSPFQGSEPALTIIPNFLVTGVLAVILGLIVAVWAALMIQRKRGVALLILFSALLFAVGGGLAPLVIELIAGAVGSQIDQPRMWKRIHLSAGLGLFLAKLWPWPFIIFFLPSLMNLQIAIFGNFFGVTNRSFAAVLVSLIFGLLLLSLFSGFAYDMQTQSNAHKNGEN